MNTQKLNFSKVHFVNNLMNILYTNFSIDYTVKDPLNFGSDYVKALESYNEQIKLIESFASKLTKSDTTHLLIVYGPPGVGKTHVVQSVVNDLGLNNKYIRAKETATELYKNAFDYREPGDFIILDDCDSIFDDPVQMNLLKAMADSYEVRKVTFDSSAYQLKDIPKSFDYKGKIIILTNRAVKGNSDYDAIVSRAKTTTMEVDNFQKVCKSIDILLSDKRYQVKGKEEYTLRAEFIAKFIWENRKIFANDKYSLRESRKLYSDLEMLDDNVDLFLKELEKSYKDKD